MTKTRNRDKPANDHVAIDLCKPYSMAGEKFLLYNTRSGKRTFVTRELCLALSHCNHFQTFDKHTSSIIGRNPSLQGQESDVRKTLQLMLDKGMMLSAEKICTSLKGEVAPQNEANKNDLPVVAVITWERPEALGRLLASISANSDKSKFHSLYMIDDSRKAENIVKNQALVRKFKSQFDAPVHYIGQDEQQSLISGLIAQLPNHEASIRFLIDQSRWRNQWTTGLSRNLALLLSSGRRLVMIDDDAICDAYNPVRSKQDIKFSDEAREADFYHSESDWAIHHKPVDANPINLHMQCLGLTVSEALVALGRENLNPEGLVNATSLDASELQAGSPVLVTECGSLGCPGTETNTWLPHMQSSSLNRLLSSERKMHNALNHRMVWSGRSQPNFAPRPNMSAITGLENREMLPPYFPILRGEDRLFSYMLDFIFPFSVTLDYPWAVPHSPIPERSWCEKDYDFSIRSSFPLLLFEKILERKSDCLANSPTDRLSVLSAWFNDIATTPAESLSALYRDLMLQGGAKKLNHLSELLVNADTVPNEWREYLKNGCRQLNVSIEQVSSPDFSLKGFPEELNSIELVTFWKKAWMEFATALKDWPQIRKAAEAFVNAHLV